MEILYQYITKKQDATISNWDDILYNYHVLEWEKV